MRKKISLLLIVLLSIVSIPVFALGENFTADESVILEKSIGYTNFVAGNRVNSTADVDGINFVAGNMITISGRQDYIFAAGNTVEIKNVETKDVFAAGSTIYIDDSSIRDLYAAAGIIEIRSDISRNAYLGGDTVKINSVIDGDVLVSADTIELGENAVITGTLKYPEDATLKKEDSAEIGKEETYKGYENSGVEITINRTARWVSRLLSFFGLLVVAFLLLLFGKASFDRVEKVEKEGMTILKTFGIGFLTLIATPMMAIIAMITVIGLPAGILTIILYGVLIYLSLIPTAYYFGKWLLKEYIKNDYLLLAAALFAITILKAIPLLGGLVSFFSLCFGLGLFVKLLFTKEKEKEKEKKK